MKKTWSAFGSEMPVARTTKTKTKATPVVTETDAALPVARTGRMEARRRWFCTERRAGCAGQSPFLDWSQLLDPPTCPNCGAAMNWHQWGVRV